MTSSNIFQVEQVRADQIKEGDHYISVHYPHGQRFRRVLSITEIGPDLQFDCEEGWRALWQGDELLFRQVAPASPEITEELRAKLDEMRLHDNTGDLLDIGYMRAIAELDEWLDR